MFSKAYNNLKLLSENKEWKETMIVTDNLSLSTMDKDKYDTVNDIKKLDNQLDYTLYFSFNVLLNNISDNYDISYLSKKKFLKLVDEAIDSSYNYLKDEDEDSNIIQVLEMVDARYDVIRERTLYNNCFENFVYLFDKVVETLRETAIEMNNMIYPTNKYIDNFLDAKETSDSEDSSEDSSEDPTKALDPKSLSESVDELLDESTGESNPNLVYDKKEN